MMSNTDYTEALETLVQQFSDLVKFHEIEAVDSKAVELLLITEELFSLEEKETDQDLGEWIEQIHQANMHEMT
jgi:stalled ribosome rescue protein Dom34